MRFMILLATLAFSSLALAQTEPREEPRLPTPVQPPLPEKVESPLAPEEVPTVNIRELDTGDVVEEYRMHGRLYEVRVRPRVGAPYTLIDVNGDGRLDRRDTEGPVAPVLYTLYEWN